MNVVPTLDNITFTGNYRNAVELSPQSWTTNSLPSTTVIYWLGGDTNVQINSTLTLSLGVKLKVPGSTKFYINGRLVADGTQGSPITFTSDKDDTVCGIGAGDESICDTNNDGTASVPAAGDWGLIQFNSGSDPTSILRRAAVRYGGYCSYYNCGGGEWRGPVRLMNMIPTLDNITFTSNYRNAVEIPSSTWISDSWDSTTVIYWLSGNITILASNTLTISPGVKIKAGNGAKLYVNGNLTADGTQAAPITFTSEKDDTVCGIGAGYEPICDTNNDTTGSVPAVGDWGWIEFGSSSDPTSVIRRAVFRYAGWAPIRLFNVSPMLENITLANNYRNAAEIPSSSWTSDSWNSTTVVYWLSGNVTILASNTLTISPGVKIKPANNTKLYINGKLLADGTQTAPITFTSEKDDTVCGVGAAEEGICDTNNDTTASIPATGDWGWMDFGSSSDSTSVIRRA